jgi:peptidoglycan/LPS O-acetylase OafA/YrhL
MKRVYGLDILRAVAILLVLYQHSFPYFHAEYYSLGDGVNLFFVLSGYLIGGILLKNDFEGYSVVNFWYRRWMRTLPAYFFTVICLILYTRQFQYLYTLTFVQGFKGEIPFFGESWSLCVEEWFYLSVPLLIFLSLKIVNDKRKVFLFWIITLIIGVFILRSLNSDFGEARKTVPLRLDSIMFGVLGSYLNYYKLINKNKILLYSGIILWVFNCVDFHLFGMNFFSRYLSVSVMSLGDLCLVLYFSTIRTGKGIIYKGFTFISLISYSLYLINATPVNAILGNDKIQALNLPQYPLFLMITFSGAYLMYRFIEKPFMKLRDKKDSKKDSNLLSKVVKVENSVIINQQIRIKKQ